MPHEIHTSERRSFRGCRRRWDFSYRQGYVPEIQPKPLEFGIAFHMAMEEFYNPDGWKERTAEDKAKDAIEIFSRECVRQRQQYMHTMKLTRLPEEVEADYDGRMDLGAGMMAYYATHVHPKYDSWFTPVRVEIPFEVPIYPPPHEGVVEFPVPLKCHNSPDCGQSHSNNWRDDDSNVVFAGRVDMLVKDERYGGYLIWDHKTASVLAPDDDFLQLDDQIASYCWSLGSILNINVTGFIYQEIRKDYPRDPKMLKRLMNGRQFSTAKDQPTIDEIFVPFVQRNDPIPYENGAYDEYIERLRGPDATLFHQRFVIRKSERELNEVGKNIYLEACEMIDPSLSIYPSVGRYTCSSCAFRQPCLAMFQGEDVEYLLSSSYNQTNRRYWMDMPRSSDKSGK